jgi:hypothetical protein
MDNFDDIEFPKKTEYYNGIGRVFFIQFCDVAEVVIIHKMI